MNQLKYIRAKNFLSIGPEGLEIDFTKYGNVIILKGKNLDIGINASNGSGKSSIIEILVYGLFGKLIKGLPHDEAIHKKVKERLEVEVHFDNCKILRCREPNKLELWIDEEKQTLGSMAKTQQEIERLVRLNYESFINVVCFGEHNNHSFLSCDAATRRSIIENLLGLDKYVKYCDVAKKKKSALEKELHDALQEYELLKGKKESAQKTVSQVFSKQLQWKIDKEKEMDSLKKTISDKKKEIELFQENSLDDSAQKTTDIQGKLIALEEAREKILGAIQDLQYKHKEALQQGNEYLSAHNNANYLLKDIKNKIENLEKENEKLKKLQDGVQCSYCWGTISKENYGKVLNLNSNQLGHYYEELKKAEEKEVHTCGIYKGHKEKFHKIQQAQQYAEGKLSEVNSKISLAHQELKKYSLGMPSSTALVLAQQKLSDCEKLLESKQNSTDPYQEILESAQQELSKFEEELTQKKSAMTEAEGILPYYDFWVKGFGDDGIRRMIIDNMLPALNSRISYWLQFLIDNKIKLTFNNQFKPILERNPPDGDPFVYNATSGGERRRINLAISQAFAYVMMLSSGAYPSIISLDEVALNVDAHGIYGIYKMICELARDRQVLVTTHDPNLSDLLENADVITVVKENGFSKLVS